MCLGIRFKWRRLVRIAMRLLSDRKTALTIILSTSSLMFASPACAQLSQVNTLLNTIQTTLLSVGGVICSISIIWLAFG